MLAHVRTLRFKHSEYQNTESQRNGPEAEPRLTSAGKAEFQIAWHQCGENDGEKKISGLTITVISNQWAL
jgi:hypothetical protein